MKLNLPAYLTAYGTFYTARPRTESDKSASLPEVNQTATTANARPGPAVDPDDLDPGNPFDDQPSQPVAPSLANDRFAGSPQLQKVLAGQLTLASGVKGEGVKAVQAALVDMGFAPVGSDDSDYGGMTTQFVRNFQVSAGLPLTGKLDAGTLEALDKMAPMSGKTAWDADAPQKIAPVVIAPGKMARIVVNKAEHRLFLFDRQGQVKFITPVGIGTDSEDKAYYTRTIKNPDGTTRTVTTDKGLPSEDPSNAHTKAGFKIITGKFEGEQLHQISRQLWHNDNSFGDHMLGLSWYNPKLDPRKDISKPLGWNQGGNRMPVSGQEIHETLVPRSGGRNVSHGCVRVPLSDFKTKIYDQVQPGDLVAIVEK